MNVLGLSLFQRNYRGDLLEVTRLLDLCGIDVACTLCARCRLDEIRSMTDADANLVLYPEYGLSAAQLLEDRFGMPYVNALPLGFDATESWIREVCACVGADPSAALEECARARAESYGHIAFVNGLTGLPKGVPFAIQGTCSQCLGFARFLVCYFGMRAECVHVLDDREANARDYEELRSVLDEWSMGDALGRCLEDSRAEFVLADANAIGKLKLRGLEFSGVEISLPSFGYVDVIPKTNIGIRGALITCEQVLNGLLF